LSAHRSWACALVLAYGTPAPGQEALSSAATLRWADVAAAIERDPRVAASRSRVRSAEGGVTAARTPPNPEVEATAGRGIAREGSARRDEWGLAISIPLDWLARRGPEVDAARANVDEVTAEGQALRAEVSVELWRLFVTAGYAQSETETLEATEQQVAALTRLVRRRVEAGEGRPVEVSRVELELERVRNDLAAARATRDGALAQLGSWVGASIRRVEVPAPPPPVEDAAVLGDLSRHPRIRAALARAAVARAEASVARRSRVPAVTVGGFYSSELDREAMGGRLAVELPLWDWKSGRVRRAEAAAEAEASRAEGERRALAAALAEAVASCGRARGVADRQKTNILPRAEESARTLERTFQLGEAGILDVIDARRVLLQARREALSSARERDVDCGALILLSGRELP
jgi:cobalt-zinc-cadmium efflux system outer membrane protein